MPKYESVYNPLIEGPMKTIEINDWAMIKGTTFCKS